MSSTSNIQTLLTNVVRPVYVYDPATSNYVAKVVVSNVDTFSVRTIEVENLEFGDARSNIYVGIDAGSTNPNSGSNVGVGIGAMENNINTKNTVAVGYRAGGANMTDVSATVAIGGSTLAGGSSNVYIGYGTGSAASNATGNVFLGAGIAPGTVSNQVRIGTDSSLAFFADMNTHRVGILTSTPGYGLDVSADMTNLQGNLQVAGTINAGGLNLATLRLPGPNTTLDASQISALELGQGDSALATQGYSGLSLQYYGGGFRHILRSRHNALANSTGNAVDVFVNNSTSSVGSGGPGAGNKLALSITGGGVGVGGILLPTAALDVSGSTKTANLIVPGYLRDGDTPSTFDISGGNISNAGTTRSFNFIGGSTTSNTIGGVTLSNSNVTVTGLTTTSNTIVSGYLRNPTQFDISGGNISNSGTVTTTNLLAGGYLRDALAPTLFDLSGGNLMLSNRIRVGNGTVAAPSMVFSNDASAGFYSPAANQIGFATGGVQRMMFSNSNIGIGLSNPAYTVDVSGIVRASGFIGTSGSGSSGGVSFSNGAVGLGDGSVSVPTLTFQNDLSLGLYRPATNVLGFVSAGSNRMTLSNANLGVGTTAPTQALDVSGVLQVSRGAGALFDVTPTGNYAGLTMNGYFAMYAPGTTNKVASNLVVSIAPESGSSNFFRFNNTGFGTTAPAYTLDVSGTTQSCNAIVTGYLRNALAPTQFDISEGNISNSGTVTTSNVIAGGYLRNALAPTQFDISGGNISNSATTQSSNFIGTASASNSIGGVTLSNSNISNSATTQSSNFIGTASASNSIGGVTLSNSNISNSGTLTTSNIRLGTGTRAAPAIAFTSDASSGLYREGTNSVTISVAGVKTANFSNNLIEFSNSGGQTLWLLNNQVQAASATVSAPAYTFAADASLGLYRAGASTLGFASAGVERMRIDSNGRIGIGTPAPQAALDVCGGGIQLYGLANTNSNPRPALSQSTTSSCPVYELRAKSAFGDDGFLRLRAGGLVTPAVASYIDITGVSTVTDMQQNIALGTSGVDRIRISSTGNVGLGTTAPTTTLDVSGTARIQQKNTSLLVTDTSAAFVQLYTAFDTYGVIRANGGLDIFQAGTAQSNASSTTPKTKLSADSGASWITGSSVGIGTTVPTASLDVSGTMVVSGGLRDVAGSTRTFDLSGGNLFLSNRILIGAGTVAAPAYTFSADASLGVYRPAANTLGFASTGLERMRIDSNGYVGIGCNAPIARLTITGSDSSSAIVMTNGSVNSTTRAVTGGLVSNEIAGLSSNGLDAGQLRISAGGGVSAANKSYIDLYGFNSRFIAMGAAGVEALRINSNAQVGIGTVAPAYRLDVSEGPTVASINMSTWTRTIASVSYYGTFNSNVSAAVAWTGVNSIDSNIVSVGTNNGTFFTINKSGIYSIQVYMAGTSAGNPAAAIDCSTNAAHNTYDRVVNTIIGQTVTPNPAGTSSFTVSYVGFLPSNALIYYKVKTNAFTPSAGRAGGRINISFLGEAPAVTSFPF